MADSINDNDTAANGQFCARDLSEEEVNIFEMELSIKLYAQYRFYFGSMPLPLTILTIACTTAYILAICKGILSRRVSRKCYLLLLNRAVGDLLSCICFLCCSTYLFIVSVNEFRVEVLLIIATLCSGCYWTAMVSYVSLSVIKLFAVYQPLKYKKVFSMSHCLHLIILSWIIYVLIVFSTLTAFALVRVPSLQRWSGCKRETCMHTVARVKNIALFIIYVFTLIVFASTAALLRTIRHSSNSLQTMVEKRSSCRFASRFPFWKLTLNVLTFALFNFFYIVMTIVLMPRSHCSIIVFHPEMVGLIGCVWTSLLVRILIDAVLGLCTDKQLRKGMSTTETSGSSSTRQNGRSRTPCSGIRRITNRCGSYPIQTASDVISTQKANSIEATNC